MQRWNCTRYWALFGRRRYTHNVAPLDFIIGGVLVDDSGDDVVEQYVANVASRILPQFNSAAARIANISTLYGKIWDINSEHLKFIHPF